jgi:hypothetical protein
MRRFAVTVLFVAFGATFASTQSAPTINAFTINNDAAETTSDAVTLRFTYTNPSGIGLPIAHYRIRYKSPTQTDFFAFGQWLPGPQGMPTLSMTLARNGTAPIPGEHRYELQLRDSRGTMSATAAASIRRVVAATAAPAPAPVLLQTYRVSGSQVADLFRMARQKGFQFAALPANGNTTCSIDDQTNNVVFRLDVRGVPSDFAPKPTCRFRAFEGRQLQPNWRLARVTLAEPPNNLDFGSRWVFEQPLKPSGRDASFVVYAEETRPRQPVGLLAINMPARMIGELQFTGPSGKAWRNAFEP